MTRGARLASALLLTLLLSREGDAAGLGVWTPKVDWSDSTAAKSEIAIHMMLLRGDDSPFHSRVMWFGSEHHHVFKGGIWGWTPDEGNCSEFPSSSFDSLFTPLAGHNVFCAGHSGLADGRMLLAGGNDDDIQAYGDDEAAFHTTGSAQEPGNWTAVDAMHSRRWYPTNTTLRDGRVLVTAGFQHRQHWIFGGRLGGGSLASDTVRRWAPVPGGAWDPPVLPEPDASFNPAQRPPVREGHAGVDLSALPNSDKQTLFFGGRNASGLALSDMWVLKREDTVPTADYRYRWENKSPVGGPSARSEHSMVVGNGGVIVFGGRVGPTTALNDMYRYAPGPEGTWAEVIVDSGVPPTPRMGHIAIYNEMNIRENHVDKSVKRLIVYGGVAAEGEAASDLTVYEFRFNPSDSTHGYWRAMCESTFTFLSRHPGGPALHVPPGPRYWHRAAAGKKQVPLATGAPLADLAYVFGGRLSNGVYSDSLWMLCFFASGKYGWVYRDVRGAGGVASEKPSPRARFSMSFDATQGETNGPRLYVHGGEGPGGLTGPEIHVIDPYVFGNDWRRWGEADYSASGHVAVRENRETHARVGEIFDPTSGDWTALTSAPLLELSYPVTFAVSGGTSDGGRVITASSWDGVTRYADLPGPGSSTMTWQTFPGTSHGIDLPQTGVMYRPNRLMIAGGEDAGVVTGQTRTLNTLATSGWQSSGNMLPRSNHNLVLLPDGTVLATGGLSNKGESTQSPVLQPQIWHPDSANGAGAWTPSGALASSSAARGYHSTAILLPDGRVLCAGGNATPPGPFRHDEFRADIYCPPYLFNADGSLANRPVLSSAPSSLSYGERFMLCVATDTATVAKVALVRPGMTTHTFDQNQRYVPLTFSLAQTVAGTERRFVADVPPDSSIVPPGDYLLFIVNGAGTPGIARWVRVRGTNGDTDPPTTVQDLAVVQDSYSSSDQGVTIDWTPPYGDQSGSCRGPAKRYRIHYRYSSMPTWNEFEVNGTPVTNPPVPGLATGPKDTVRLTGLPDGVQVHVRLVSKDFAHDDGNWSALSSELAFWVNPGGGEGGGGEGEIIPPLRSAEVAAVATLEGSVAPTGFLENTLFPGGLAAEPRTDRLLLHNGPRMQDGRAQVRVSQPSSTTLELQALRLVAVDHASDLALDAGDGRLLGSFEPAAVVERNGVDVAAALEASGPLTLSPREPLVVRFDEVGGSALMLLASRAGEDMGPLRGGVHVEARGSEGWVSIGHVLPRRLATQMLLRGPQAREYRLTAGESVVVHAVGRLVAGTGTATETVLDPVALEHSSAGPLAPSSANGLRVASGEALVADFVPPPLASGLTRTWFLEVTASRAASAAQISAEAVVKADISPTPERLLLRAPVPNPSNAAAHVGFDLPRATHAVVEVFDLLGRRLAVLAERSFPAGSHLLLWDGRLPSGASAPPGVYSVRLRAEGIVHRVRLVRMR